MRENIQIWQDMYSTDQEFLKTHKNYPLTLREERVISKKRHRKKKRIRQNKRFAYYTASFIEWVLSIFVQLQFISIRFDNLRPEVLIDNPS